MILSGLDPREPQRLYLKHAYVIFLKIKSRPLSYSYFLDVVPKKSACIIIPNNVSHILQIKYHKQNFNNYF